jgi:hypothetical protein
MAEAAAVNHSDVNQSDVKEMDVDKKKYIELTNLFLRFETDFISRKQTTDPNKIVNLVFEKDQIHNYINNRVKDDEAKKTEKLEKLKERSKNEEEYLRSVKEYNRDQKECQNIVICPDDRNYFFNLVEINDESTKYFFLVLSKKDRKEFFTLQFDSGDLTDEETDKFKKIFTDYVDNKENDEPLETIYNKFLKKVPLTSEEEEVDVIFPPLRDLEKEDFSYKTGLFENGEWIVEQNNDHTINEDLRLDLENQILYNYAEVLERGKDTLNCGNPNSNYYHVIKMPRGHTYMYNFIIIADYVVLTFGTHENSRFFLISFKRSSISDEDFEKLKEIPLEYNKTIEDNGVVEYINNHLNKNVIKVNIYDKLLNDEPVTKVFPFLKGVPHYFFDSKVDLEEYQDIINSHQNSFLKNFYFYSPSFGNFELFVTYEEQKHDNYDVGADKFFGSTLCNIMRIKFSFLKDKIMQKENVIFQNFRDIEKIARKIPETENEMPEFKICFNGPYPYLTFQFYATNMCYLTPLFEFSHATWEKKYAVKDLFYQKILGLSIQRYAQSIGIGIGPNFFDTIMREYVKNPF